MSDIVDRAAQAEEVFLSDALEQRRLPENRFSYSHCEDCGEEIPEARRRVVKGCRRCIECQEVFEKGVR